MMSRNTHPLIKTVLKLDFQLRCFLSHISDNMQKQQLTTGAPNDVFLSDPLKRCFRLSGVPLKLCGFILGCAIGELEYFRNYQGIFVYLPKTLILFPFRKSVS